MRASRVSRVTSLMGCCSAAAVCALLGNGVRVDQLRGSAMCPLGGGVAGTNPLPTRSKANETTSLPSLAEPAAAAMQEICCRG